MIAITGANGQLGLRIIKRLLGQGVSAPEIVAVVRTAHKAVDLANKGVLVRQGDYEDPPSLESAFEGINTVMFISNTDLANRERQHNNVVNAAKEAGVNRLVYTSIVDLGDDNPLAQSHRSSEQAIIASGLNWTFFRNNFYMDGYVAEVEIAMKTGTYRTPTRGDAGAALVSRDDISRAAAVVLTSEGHNGRIYNLTGPALVTPQVFAAVASELSGKEKVTYQQITWDELAADYAERGMPQAYVGIAVSVEQIIASNALADISDDVYRLTGRPATDFGDFVKRQLLDI